MPTAESTIQKRWGYMMALAVLMLQTATVFFGKRASLLLLKNPRLRGLQILWQNPFYLTGMALLVVSSLIWPFTLKRLELNRAYSILSLQYLGALAIAWLFYNENIDLPNLLGAILIALGVWMINTGN